MDIRVDIKKTLDEAVRTLGFSEVVFSLEHPADITHGDYATNVALVVSKQVRTHASSEKLNPKDTALLIKKELEKVPLPYVEKIEIAGPGFINFYLTRSFFASSIQEILKQKSSFGHNALYKGKKVLVEYTDPNPFKQFHIGHLMSNAIGESISRLFAVSGARVKRACYQGDFGLHVAKALWAILKHRDVFPSKKTPLSERTAFLGACYVEGAEAYDNDPQAKTEIEVLNKKIFEKKDKEIRAFYDAGKKWSLEHFEELYALLGTQFDYYFFESEVAPDGIELVRRFTEKGVFEKSDNAIVFKAERFDTKLHTRVFINSQGLPTYETKELGLNTKKYKKIRPDKSIIITANEQSDYFRVVLKALEIVAPEARKITEHISHGMLRFAQGKMSSRKGNVITGESMINDIRDLVLEKMKDREMDEEEKKEVSDIVAVAAIKYSILKQVTSSDIIFDFEKSISFEGDSGPYLLYTAVRAQSVLEKAKKEGIKARIQTSLDETVLLEKKLCQFPEIVSRSSEERSPHFVATYLIELAALFNSWYAHHPIVVAGSVESPHRVAITTAVHVVLENGLDVLGIRIPKKM